MDKYVGETFLSVGFLLMGSLKRINNVTMPIKVNECLILNSLEECDELVLPKYVGVLSMKKMKSLDNVVMPKKIVYGVSLNDKIIDKNKKL